MKLRTIQWLGYLMVSLALGSAGITLTDWQWWLGMVGVGVAVLANYYEGRTHGVGAGGEGQQIVECVFCKKQMLDGSQCVRPTVAAVCDMRNAGVDACDGEQTNG